MSVYWDESRLFRSPCDANLTKLSDDYFCGATARALSSPLISQTRQAPVLRR